MIRFVFTFFMSLVLWVTFTLSLEPLELLIGVVVSMLITLLSYKIVFHKKAGRWFNPMRLGAVILYLFAFIYAEIKSHLDVTYRIITGRIRPAFIEVQTQIKRDSGRALLGNTITITPGTLTIKTDSKMLIHWLSYKKNERPGMIFEKLGRMIAE